MTTNFESNAEPAKQSPINIDEPLLQAISAPHSAGGLLVAVNTVCRCLEAAHKLMPSERANEWLTRANQLLQETQTLSSSHSAIAIVASKESSAPVYSSFAAPARCAIRKDRLERVDAMLGIAVVAAVSGEGTVPKAFAASWQTLRRACSGRGNHERDWELLAEHLPVSQEEIKRFLEIAKHDVVRKFCIDLLRMVAAAVALPPEHTTANETSDASTQEEIENGDDQEESSDEDQYLGDDPKQRPLPEAGKIIEWQMKGATFARYADKVGLPVSADRIPPADLKVLCRKLKLSIESAVEKFQKFAFAAFVSLLCALPIQIALFLSLRRNDDIYLLLDEGAVYWNYRKVQKRRGESSAEDSALETSTDLLHVRIPIAQFLAAFGQRLLTERPDATTLAELLEVPNEATERVIWLKEFGLYLRSCGDEVYPPYPARYARSLPYVYLEKSEQDLIAAALAFGFAPATAGMLNYVNIDRAQIEKYVQQVYDFLDLGPAAPMPSSFESCGSTHAPTQEIFTEGWNRMMQDISGSLLAARKATTDEDFILSFNQFVTLHLTALVTLSAHRAQRLERLTNGAIYFHPTVMYFADKDSAIYVQSRLVPKTKLLTELQGHHKANLRVLAKQAKARGITSTVLEEISEGIDRFDRVAHFRLELTTDKDGKKQVKRTKCTPAHIEVCTQTYFKKKRNCGRHFWVTQGCRNLFDRWGLRVLTGHVRQDAEPLHEFGLVAPSLALSDLKRQMDKLIEQLGLQGPQSQTAQTRKNHFASNFPFVPLPKSYSLSEVRKAKIEGGQKTHQGNLFTSRSIPAICLIDNVRIKLINEPGDIGKGAGLLLHFACFDGVINLEDLQVIFKDLKSHLLQIGGKPVLCFSRKDSKQEITVPLQASTQIYLKTNIPNDERGDWHQATSEAAKWLSKSFSEFALPSSAARCIDTFLNCLNHWAHFNLPPAVNTLYQPGSLAATFSRLSILRLAGIEKSTGTVAFPAWTPVDEKTYQEKNQSLDQVLKCLNRAADTNKRFGQNFSRAQRLQQDLVELPATLSNGPADVVKRVIQHEDEKILTGAPDPLELSSLATYMSGLRQTLESIPAYQTLDSFLADDWHNFYSSATHVESPRKKSAVDDARLKSLKEDRIAAANRFLKVLAELGFWIPRSLLQSDGRNNFHEAMRLPASSVYIEDANTKQISDLIKTGLSDYPTHTARALLKLQLFSEVPLRYGISASLPIGCFTKEAGCLVIRDMGFSVSKTKRHQLVSVSSELQAQITKLGDKLLRADPNTPFLFLQNEAVHDLGSDGWLHELLTKLLQLTTGDSTARIHSFRAQVYASHAVPAWDQTARQLLEGSAGPQVSLSLFTPIKPLWTSFAKAAAEAGHSSRHTGGMYYLAGWPLIRAAALSATLAHTPPPANLASELGFSEGALRKARQRFDGNGSVFDPWAWLCKGLKFDSLMRFQANETVEVPVAPERDPPAALSSNSVEQSIIYCARRMLNQTTDATQTLLRLPTSLVSVLDSKLPSSEVMLKLRKRTNSPPHGRALSADIRSLSSPDAKIFISARAKKLLPHDANLLALLSSTPTSEPSTWKDKDAAGAEIENALQSLPNDFSMEISFGERHFSPALAASLALIPRVVIGKVLRDLGPTPRVLVIYTKVDLRTDVSKSRLTALLRVLLCSVLVVHSINK